MSRIGITEASREGFATGSDDAAIVGSEPIIERDELGSVSLDLGGSGGGITDEFDADIHVGRDKRNADGSYTRKRGRKRSGNTTIASSSKKNSHSVNTIENALVGIHAMAAAFTKTPELVLEGDESKPLAEAVAELSKHYDIPGLDAKAMAWVGLIMVAGKVYVPRAVLVKQRLDKEAATKKQNTPRKQAPAPQQEPASNVVEFDVLNPPYN